MAVADAAGKIDPEVATTIAGVAAAILGIASNLFASGAFAKLRRRPVSSGEQSATESAVAGPEFRSRPTLPASVDKQLRDHGLVQG